MKLVTVMLQDHQYALLAELGQEYKLLPAQVLAKILDDYLTIQLALWDIHQGRIRGHG